MFGYSANMMEDSYVIKYLRWLESKMYFTNSCSNAYSHGNYRMNNAKQELEIIKNKRKNREKNIMRLYKKLFFTSELQTLAQRRRRFFAVHRA